MAEPSVYINGERLTQARIDALEPSAYRDAAQDALNEVRADERQQAQYDQQMAKAKTPAKVSEIEARAAAAHQKAQDQIALQEAKAAAVERQEQAKGKRKREENRISQQRARSRKAGQTHHEAIQVSRPSLTSTSILPESPETRFLDLALAIGIGGGSAWYTSSRPTAGARLGWGAFFTGLGILSAVEGRGSTLKYGGMGTGVANGTALLFELLNLPK